MKKKLAATAIGAAMVLSMGTGVLAGANLQEIKAYLNGSITVKYNGSPVQLQDEQGAVVLPITYDGNTYLPVRSIAKTLNVAVNYDGATNTVLLGEQAEGIALAKDFEDSSYHTKDPALTTYKGKDYKDVYFDNAKSSRGSSFMLYPKGKYQKLVLQVAATGNDIESFFVQDSKKDIKLKTTTIAIQDGLKTIEVDIAGVEELFVHADIKGDGGMFVPLTTSYFK
ncbi:stalk domain-containing protein [Paenibacillus sp. GbtcB18]|uniref:stalk domain-containing protein n=1 Tax=Paenibacillus sp. GbtcB18 TaxID=2824763 RepID=UPI001C30E91D|nr:stalk domain-containing protein [Paenibacillus sp. GbtcB18]